jgi:hypothetical protein
MIDGFRAIADIPNFNTWRERTGLNFNIPVDIDTGDVEVWRDWSSKDEIVHTYKGKYERYVLTVKQVDVYDNNGLLQSQHFILFIKGSFHKNHERGTNYKRFGYVDLQAEIKHLCDGLQLQPQDIRLQNIEVGVNLLLPYNVNWFINTAVLLHKTIAYTDYRPDRTGRILGRYAEHAQYSIKCYDKGVQNLLDYQLMRFEVRITKMQAVSAYGIETVADLMNRNKVAALLRLLTVAWDNTLTHEPSLDTNTAALTDIQKELMKEGRNRDYWLRLHREKGQYFNKQRTKFRQLSKQYTTSRTHEVVRGLIVSEWGELV